VISYNGKRLTQPFTNEREWSLTSEIEKKRKAYLPEEVSWMLIAESPPSNPERFFYYPNVKEHDHLFLAVMQTLYPELYHSYMSSSRASHVKVNLLKRFQLDGFYLLDLFKSSSDISKVHKNQAVRRMIKSLRAVAAQDTPIILIKSTVYDILADPLVEAGFINVARERIPFPLYQWKFVFLERFSRALFKAGFKTEE